MPVSASHMFRHLLERRCMVVLFDGLDEVTGLHERQALVMAIEDFAHRYPGNTCLSLPDQQVMRWRASRM